MNWNHASHIKSKARVREHGEVLTGEREVQAMLDLFPSSTWNLTSRWLEPACGTGNFLIAIANRKLAYYRSMSSSIVSAETFFLLLGSLYGVEIQRDNVDETRERLLRWVIEHVRLTSEERAVIEALLARQIVWGDGLTGFQMEPADTPIYWDEWQKVGEYLIQRRYDAPTVLCPNTVALPLFTVIYSFEELVENGGMM